MNPHLVESNYNIIVPEKLFGKIIISTKQCMLHASMPCSNLLFNTVQILA